MLPFKKSLPSFSAILLTAVFIAGNEANGVECTGVLTKSCRIDTDTCHDDNAAFVLGYDKRYYQCEEKYDNYAGESICSNNNYPCSAPASAKVTPSKGSPVPPPSKKGNSGPPGGRPLSQEEEPIGPGND